MYAVRNYLIQPYWVISWNFKMLADHRNQSKNRNISIFCTVFSHFRSDYRHKILLWITLVYTCSGVGQLLICFLYHFHGFISVLKLNPVFCLDFHISQRFWWIWSLNIQWQSTSLGVAQLYIRDQNGIQKTSDPTTIEHKSYSYDF